MTSETVGEALDRALKEIFKSGWQAHSRDELVKVLNKRKLISFNCAVIWLPSTPSSLKRKRKAIAPFIGRLQSLVVFDTLHKTSDRTRALYYRLKLRKWWDRQRAPKVEGKEPEKSGAEEKAVEAHFDPAHPAWRSVAGILQRELGWLISPEVEIVIQTTILKESKDFQALMSKTLDAGGDLAFMTIPDALNMEWEDLDERAVWIDLYRTAMDAAWAHEKAQLSHARLTRDLHGAKPGDAKPADDEERL